MRAAALLVAVAVGSGCAAQPPGGADLPPAAPALSQAALQAIAVRADEVRLASLASGPEAQSAGIFAGPAARLIERNVRRAVRLQEQLVTVVTARSLVHSSVTGDQATAVVETHGRQRVVSGGGASAWDDFADQWQYSLRWTGAWLVWAAVDVPPGQWWTS